MILKNISTDNKILLGAAVLLGVAFYFHVKSKKDPIFANANGATKVKGLKF